MARRIRKQGRASAIPSKDRAIAKRVGNVTYNVTQNSADLTQLQSDLDAAELEIDQLQADLDQAELDIDALETAVAAIGETGYYEPLTNGNVSSPELVFANGDVIMVEVT